MFTRLSNKVKKFWASLALLSVEMILIVAVFFAALVSFVFIVRRVFYVKNEELDNRVFTAVKPLINPINTEFMNFVTFFGKHEFLIPANLALIAYFLIRKRRWYSIKIPALAISSLLIMFGMKHLFGRQRPSDQILEQATNFSFPSGHALMSVTFYGLIIYWVWQSVKRPWLKWTISLLLLAWILLIGFSRIYLRRHYYSDVMAGYCIGFLWLTFALWMLNRMERFSRNKLAKAVAANPAPTPAS